MSRVASHQTLLSHADSREYVLEIPVRLDLQASGLPIYRVTLVAMLVQAA